MAGLKLTHWHMMQGMRRTVACLHRIPF